MSNLLEKELELNAKKKELELRKKEVELKNLEKEVEELENPTPFIESSFGKKVVDFIGYMIIYFVCVYALAFFFAYLSMLIFDLGEEADNWFLLWFIPALLLVAKFSPDKKK